VVKSKLDSMPVWVKKDQVVFINWRVIDGSSHIEKIGWPVSGEPLMLVEYKDGGLYGYLGVSRQQAVATANAPSVGRYLHRKIKSKFRGMKIVS
jgi:hypothetical protein